MFENPLNNKNDQQTENGCSVMVLTTINYKRLRTDFFSAFMLTLGGL